MPNAHLPFSQRWLPLLKVLLIPLSLHSCATGMRFTATLDALSRGAGPFETGAMLACISLFPAFFAVKVGRWLDSAGPRAPIHAALFAAAGSGLAEIGWVLGSFACATFVVRLLMPMLLKVLEEWHLIAMTLLVSAVAFALFPFFNTLFPLMCAAFLLGLGLGASLPNMMSLVYRFAPGNRIGEAIGFRLMLINSGKSAFPVIAGAIGSVIGAGASLFGLAVFTGGGFLFALYSAGAVFSRMKELDGE